MSDYPLSVVIPAAGSSQRLGHAKQLVQLSGKSLLQIAIELASTLQPLEIIVVLGANTDQIQPVIEKTSLQVRRLTSVNNPNWTNGIGSSIATGIAATSEHAKGAMILLSDQWKITANDLAAIKNTWLSSPDSVVISNAGGTLGPPVIFPDDCFPALCKLAGDRGAISVVQSNMHRIHKVQIDNASVDLDTPGDLEALQSSDKLS